MQFMPFRGYNTNLHKKKIYVQQTRMNFSIQFSWLAISQSIYTSKIYQEAIYDDGNKAKLFQNLVIMV